MFIWVRRHPLIAGLALAGFTIASVFGIFLYYLNSLLFLPLI